MLDKFAFNVLALVSSTTESVLRLTKLANHIACDILALKEDLCNTYITV